MDGVLLFVGDCVVGEARVVVVARAEAPLGWCSLLLLLLLLLGRIYSLDLDLGALGRLEL